MYFLMGIVVGWMGAMIGVYFDHKFKTGIFFEEERGDDELIDTFSTKEVAAKSQGYTINKGGKSITCHTCERTSYSQMDVKNKYCGFCHNYHEDKI